MGGINTKITSSAHSIFSKSSSTVKIGGKDILSVFLIDCNNASHYSNKNIKSYLDKRLKAKISYGNNEHSILHAPFVKRPVWEKGYVQFPFKSHHNTIHIDVESSDGQKIGSATVPIDQYHPNKLHTIKLNNTKGKDDDGEEDSTTVSLLFSSDDLDELDIIKSTRKGKTKSIILEDSIDSLDNGDVILYDGGDSLLSKWIKKGTCRPYSHCGLVVKTLPPRKKGEPIPTKKELYIIESVLGYDAGKDPFRQVDVLAGVNIYPLKQRLLDYDGFGVWCLKQKTPFTEDQREAYLMSVWDYHGRRVPFDVLNSSLMTLGLKPLLREGNGAVFCSELATQILYNANALTPEESNHKASSIDPGQLSDFHCYGGGLVHPQLLRFEINNNNNNPTNNNNIII